MSLHAKARSRRDPVSWPAFPYLCQCLVALALSTFHLLQLRDAFANTAHAAAAVAVLGCGVIPGALLLLSRVTKGRADRAELRAAETGVGPDWRAGATLRPPYLIRRIQVVEADRARLVIAVAPLLLAGPAWAAARIHGPVLVGAGALFAAMLVMGAGFAGLERQDSDLAWDEVARAAAEVPLPYVPASAVAQRGGDVILGRCGVAAGSAVADVAVRLASQSSPPAGGVLEFVELARAIATDTRPASPPAAPPVAAAGTRTGTVRGHAGP